MKSFLKYTLATITGLLICSVLLFFISLAGLSIMMASADKPVSISSNSVLVLNTGLTIPEKGIKDPWSTFDPVDFTFKPAPGINDIISNLDRAATDERIKGVLIENGLMANGWGKAEEIRNALLRFKESGKFIISYTDYLLTQESYYISSVADSIYLNPNSLMEFKGLASEVIFYKNALDKLGINIQVIRHGKYKGAVEPFIRDELSEANRTQIKNYITSLWSHIINQVSASRNIDPADLNDIADRLSALDVEKAAESGLIDRLIYRDELIEKLKELTGAEEGKKPEYVSMVRYSNVKNDVTEKAESSVAVIYAEGTITMGKGSTGSIGDERYSSIIRKIREKGDHDAIVLRINSPGGNAMASDNIWRELELASREMPVVVSMSNYAASGGYYMAVPATTIFAQPTTLTGSIGVFGLYPEASELMNDKLGISTDVVKTNENSDMLSPFRGMSSHERMIYQQNVDKTYMQFVSRVAEGRGMDREKVDSMGQGQVYSGSDALERRLIDKTGGLTEAIEEAATLASIEDYRIREYPRYEDTYTRLMKSLSGGITTRIIKRSLGNMARYYDNINELRSVEGVQARLPYFIEIR